MIGGRWQVVSIANVFPGGPISLLSWEVCGVVQFVLIAYGIAASEGKGTSNGVDQHAVGPLGCTFILDDEFGRPNNGLFVWRFGVLLAGDAKAHQVIPALPIAPPREVAEAGSS